MQFLVAQLVGALLTICASMVGRVLLALSFGFVTYTGFNLTTDWLLANIKTNFGGMPAEVVSFLAWLYVDRAIGLVFSAYSAALLIKLAGSTSLTKLVHK